MADLSLVEDPNAEDYGDLRIIGSDLVLTDDVDPRGSQAIRQDMLARLRTFRGEWFLDTTIGVPYYQTVLVKSPDMTAIATALKDEILNTPGILTLDRFTARVIPGTRTLAVSFAASTVLGQVVYSGILSNSSQDQQGAL